MDIRENPRHSRLQLSVTDHNTTYVVFGQRYDRAFIKCTLMTSTGQRSLERLVQRQLVARLLDQEHGDAITVVASQNDTVPIQQETFHTGQVRGVRPVERPGEVFAGQQRPDQLQQHG